MGDIVFKTGQVTTTDKVRAYFDYLFRVEQSGDPFPVDMDAVWPIAYAAKSTAKRALVESGEFYEDEDYLLNRNVEHPERPPGVGGGGLNKEKIYFSVACFEYLVARKVRPVFEIYRQCRIEVTKAAAARARLPYHLRRYLANHDQVPFGYFSILQEITTKLIAPLEIQGYTLPDRMVPDISVGRVFSNWLRKVKGVDPDTFDTYDHSYEDGRVVKARLYPLELLSDFVGQFQQDWLTNRAADYFKDRDETALPYLPKIVRVTKKPDEIEDGSD